MWITFLVYDLILRVYAFLIGLSSIFNSKAKLWVMGRKGWRQSLIGKIPSGKSVIWMHCASLGEFEQGRPVLEALRKDYPNHFLLLTFFSPSGYEVRKNYQGADHICYLPMDSRKNAKDFLRITQPALVIFVKYEFWLHYIFETHRQNIPLLLISAIFRSDQIFFKFYGKGFRKMLTMYAQIFLQDEHSFQLLKTAKLDNGTVAGDSRFDRVLTVMKNANRFTEIEIFLQGKTSWVAGSTWSADEKILKECLDQIPKWIIAPHEINEEHLSQIERLFDEKSVRYSEMKLSPENYTDKSILLIDNIGMLSSLYLYGKVAYIGGGFGAGIHNVPEAAVYGIPVVFGPKYKKFREASDLVSENAAFSINNAEELKNIITKLEDENFRTTAGSFCRNYIHKNAGATEKIMEFIQTKRFLTKV